MSKQQWILMPLVLLVVSATANGQTLNASPELQAAQACRQQMREYKPQLRELRTQYTEARSRDDRSSATSLREQMEFLRSQAEQQRVACTPAPQ